MLYNLMAFVMCLGVARCRDATSTFKSLPTISNSLVNLGKMDISFHFNSKFPEIPKIPSTVMKTERSSPQSSSLFFSKNEQSIEEPCPCSSFNNMKNSLAHPSEILNKILMNNDLFSSKDSVTSVNCCDSHEHTQEDTVFFEIGPKQNHNGVNPMQSNSMLRLPFIFENLMPIRPTLPAQPIKPKAIDILFFPKKKEMTPYDYNKASPKKKAEIQIVGDKELRNDFKTYKFIPSVPVSTVAKKDLSADNVEKKTTLNNTKETPKVTVANINAI